ncbi:zinc transporter ZupT [Brachybacterium huguangmaarense]
MLLALLMTLLAGGATTIGALIGITGRSGSDRVLTAGLGFSSGVMLYVSFVELLPQGARVLAGGGGATRASTAWAVLAFFGGIAAIALLDRLVPADMNPHEMPGAEGAHPERARLLRTGLVTALALAIHNVPEGMATFVSALQSPDIAIPVVIAIAMHNIPEGIAVALPVVRATGSRRRAFWLATLSGLAEPAGAVIGVLLLGSALQGPGMGAVLAAVAGVMVFVSLDELLPAAEEHGEHHVAIHSLVAGMALMALTLLIL